MAAQKHPKKKILVSNLMFFVLRETLHFEKSKSANFKDNNSVFQISH